MKLMAKRLLLILLTVPALCAVMASPANAREKVTLLADVYTDDWYAPAAEYCYQHEIMYPDTYLNFNPNLPVSRAGVMSALYGTVSPHPDIGFSHHSFTDMAFLKDPEAATLLNPEGLNRFAVEWHLDWAELMGIATGYPDGSFRPMDPVSRQQLAVFLWRMLGKPAAPTASEPFTDDAAIASYAREAVYWAKSEGYLNGRADGSFNPEGSVSRAHLAQMIMNYHSRPENGPVYGYALLYDDGTLVFQRDDAPEPGATLRETYELRTYFGAMMPWQKSGFKKAVFRDKIQPPAQANNWFSMCREMESVENLSNLDLCRVVSAVGMFRYCLKLSSVDLSGLDLSHAEDISGMFWGCESLADLNLGALDTSRVANMRDMFNGCRSLTELDLSALDTGRVINMQSLFAACKNLAKLNLNGMDTSNVEDMESMFQNCESLESLDLSGFDTSSVTEMSMMFSGCANLKTLDLSSFDVRKVIRMTSMYYNCASLTTIWASDKFILSEVVGSGYRPIITLPTGVQEEQGIGNFTGMMFSGCVSLAGGNGTRFDESHTDGTYARVDGGPGAPGYFTLKN